MDAAIQRFLPNISAVRAQLALLVVTVTVLSAFVKNIGALAIMIPVAFQFARRSGVRPSVFLMPMAFGSLLGGLMTQVGTSPNIVVSRVRQEMTGEPLHACSISPRSAPRSPPSASSSWCFAYRLLPERRREMPRLQAAIEITDYTTEAEVAADTPVIGNRRAELVKIADGDAVVTAILRARPACGAIARRQAATPAISC